MSGSVPFGLPVYCERVVDGFWGEPLNAISNAAFIIAALVGFAVWKNLGGKDRAGFWLCVSGFVVGLGSFAWHTVRMPMTLMMDVIPIQIFVFSYFMLALRRFFNLSWLLTGLCLAGFAAATVIIRQIVPPTTLAGGANYIPALLMLYAMGAILVLRARFAMHRDISLTGRAAAASDALHLPRVQAGYSLLMAGVLFVISLAMRTFDLQVCAKFAIGLHFFWHIFNGAVIGVLLVAALRYGARSIQDLKVK